MPRLLLLRHAKSDWGDPALRDFDRPLNARGRSAAVAMAAYLAEARLKPDLILCSTARRTRETLARLLPAMSHETDIRLLHTLYEDSEGHYLPQIRQFGKDAKTLILIGHNPALEQTAHGLFGAGSGDCKADMELKYPSGALTVYDCPVGRWADLQPASCHLETFVKPRSLAGEDT